jgi:2-isopropylmalate synthase
VSVADGQPRQEAATGDGPVDAVYKAIDRIAGIPNKLLEYSVQSVTAGIDALGEVSIRVQTGAGTFIGRGASTDVIVASARAYVNALNKAAAAQRERAAHQGTANGADGADGVPAGNLPAEPALA